MERKSSNVSVSSSNWKRFNCLCYKKCQGHLLPESWLFIGCLIEYLGVHPTWERNSWHNKKKKKVTRVRQKAWPGFPEQGSQPFIWGAGRLTSNYLFASSKSCSSGYLKITVKHFRKSGNKCFVNFFPFSGIRGSGSGQPPGCGLLFEESIPVPWVGLYPFPCSLHWLRFSGGFWYGLPKESSNLPCPPPFGWLCKTLLIIGFWLYC